MASSPGTTRRPALAGLTFDLDGTLIDSLPALRRVYDEFLAAHDRRGSDQEFARLNGPHMATIVATLISAHGLTGGLDELLVGWRERVCAVYARDVRPFPGADELLHWAAGSGLRRALVTSSPRVLVTAIVAHCGWSEAFDVLVCGDQVEHAKPHPEIYQRACAALGVEPAQCAALEDAPLGVQAARAAGVRVIGIAAPQIQGQLRQAGAERVVWTLGEARRLLEQEWLAPR